MTRAWQARVPLLERPIVMLKVGTALLGVGVVWGTLWLADRSERVYYRFVHEVLANPDEIRGKRLEVRGHVGCGSIQRRVGTGHTRFAIEDDFVRGSIEARYTGRLPEDFASGTYVLVLGRLSADGSLDVVEDGILMRTPCSLEFQPSPEERCPVTLSF
jgi:cytochrome c-type biogenesis protein CcmE